MRVQTGQFSNATGRVKKTRLGSFGLEPGGPGRGIDHERMGPSFGAVDEATRRPTERRSASVGADADEPIKAQRDRQQRRA